MKQLLEKLNANSGVERGYESLVHTMKKNLLIAGIGLVTLAAILTALAKVLAIPGLVLMTARWAAIAVLAGYAALRRSLTPWILVGMLAGAEFGHDWPHAAANLKVLSQ